jgi:hypothetical protein
MPKHREWHIEVEEKQNQTTKFCCQERSLNVNIAGKNVTLKWKEARI